MDYRQVRLFDPPNGRLLHTFPASATHRTGGTPNKAFSGDGSKLVCTLQDEAHVWNTVTGKSLGKFSPLENKVTGVAISADAKYLAAGGNRGKILLWDLALEKLLHVFSSDSTLPIYLVAFSPDGKTLAGQQHFRKTIRLWD